MTIGEAQKIEELANLVNEINSREKILRSEIGPQVRLGGVLREISAIVPRAISMKSLGYSREAQFSMDLEGIVQTRQGSPDLVLANFLEHINESPFFENSSLESRSSEDQGEKAIQFVIKAHLVVPNESTV